MKRLVFFICTLLCANVLLAQTKFWVDSLQYEVTSTNPAKVKVYDANSSITTAIIPATVSYNGTTYSVTYIGDAAFSWCSSLTSVTIPNSVTSIEKQAFRYCTSLESINLSDNIASIGRNCFDSCINLTNVNIPTSLSVIDTSVFRKCTSLTTVTIPENITDIKAWAFYRCSSLTSVTIPNSVTSIGNYAFSYCSSLSSVNIPNSVISIGEGALAFCSSLTSVTIPNSITLIEDSTFYECSSLTSVTIPNSVTTIRDYAFRSCSNLTTLNFNAINCNNFSHYYHPFDNCPISTINIGDSVQRIPAYFANNLYSLTSVTIGNSVTYIGNNAFYDCSSLTSVTIPNSVTSIGYAAFYNCSSLTSVTIPNSVTSIGEMAFYGGLALNTVTIGEGVTSISENCFKNCNVLMFVNLGSNVNFIRNGAFGNSQFLQNVTCLATTPPTISGNTAFPYPNTATLTIPCGSLEAYSAPTSLWNVLFSGRISEDGYDIAATVNNDAWGSVAIENNCSTATLTANANACYKFVGWNDGNTETPRLISLSSDTTFTATFEEIVFDTTINAIINTGETYAEFGFNESESGTYVQNLQTVNGCDSTITLVLSVNSSLYDVAELAEITFYPNPTSGKVTFNQAIEKVEVIDLSGKTLQTYENANEINIEALPAGVYHLRMTIGDKTITKKIIKE